MTDTPESVIQKNAAAPRKASADLVSVEQHPIPDQIAADKYAQSRKASRAKGLGLKLVKLSPGGAA